MLKEAENVIWFHIGNVRQALQTLHLIFLRGGGVGKVSGFYTSLNTVDLSPCNVSRFLFAFRFDFISINCYGI